MEMFSDPQQAPVELQKLSVTAQTTSTLAKIRNMSQKIQNLIRDNLVIENATLWLSLQLNSIDRDPHPHDLAAVALALEISESVSREAAFQLLSKYRIETGEFMFWGSDGEDGQREVEISGDTQQILPNPVLCCQSLSGRATAMALMTYTIRRELLQKPIVTWLHARRHQHSGWGDSVTTALATKALVDYTILRSSSEEAHLGVRLEMVDFGTGKSKTKLLTINRWEMGPHSFEESFSIEGGVVTVTIQGEGQAILQMSQEHSVTSTEELDVSPVTAYELELRVWNNSKQIYLESCQSWLCPYQTGYSGPSIVQVDLPSGFIVTNKHGMEDVASIQTFNSTMYIQYKYVSITLT